MFTWWCNTVVELLSVAQLEPVIMSGLHIAPNLLKVSTVFACSAPTPHPRYYLLLFIIDLIIEHRSSTRLNDIVLIAVFRHIRLLL